MSLVRPRVLGAAVILASLCAVSGVARSADDDAPPPAGGVCPSIEEDGMLCASDPLGLDGNCTGFVAAADRLGALYRSEVQKHPDSKPGFLSTSWWGCGPPTLYDVKRLLVRLGSPPAAAVLKTEPYRSLPEVPSDALPPPSDSLSCIDLPNPVDRNLCVGVKLQAARSDHRNAYELCKTRVANPLRDDLLNSEEAFETEMRALCDANTSGAGESAQARAFDRAECRTRAYKERTKAMIDMHPECAPGN